MTCSVSTVKLICKLCCLESEELRCGPACRPLGFKWLTTLHAVLQKPNYILLLFVLEPHPHLQVLKTFNPCLYSFTELSAWLLCLILCDLFALCCVFQTRSLLSVFEEDAGTLTDYTNQLLQSMQRVFGAQVHKCTVRMYSQCLDRGVYGYIFQKYTMRSEERRVGNECLRRCRSRGAPWH